jgi:general secretion pathway protein D
MTGLRRQDRVHFAYLPLDRYTGRPVSQCIFWSLRRALDPIPVSTTSCGTALAISLSIVLVIALATTFTPTAAAQQQWNSPRSSQAGANQAAPPQTGPSQAVLSDLQMEGDDNEEADTRPSPQTEPERNSTLEPIQRPEPLPRYAPRRSSSLQEERRLDMSGPKLKVIEFNDIPLQEAARILSERVNLKIVPTSKAAEVQVSLYLRDVPPMVAVDALTKAHGLFWRRDSETEIIRIFTVDEYEADLAGFREEETEVFTLLYPNPLDIALAIRDLFGDRVVLNMGMFTDMLVVQDLMQRFMRFNMVEMQNNMGGGFGGGFGGGMGGGFGGGFGGGMGGMGMGGMGGFGMGGMGMGGMGMGGMGMGMGGMGMGMGGMGMGGFGMGGMGMQAAQQPLPEPWPAIEGLQAEQIQALERARQDADSPTSQAAIDELLRRQRARIYLSVIRRQNQLVVRTADQRTMDRIRELVHQLDVPTPLVLLEVKVLALELDDGFSSVFDYQFTDGNTTAGQFTTGDILPPLGDQVEGTARRFSSLTPQGPEVNPNAMIFQVVNDNFRARIQLLENKNRVTQVATPMLLTANNEVSRIFIGQTVPVTVGFTPPTVVPGALGTNVTLPAAPVTQLQDLGQSLIVTPSINADRTVTLRLGQQNSRLVPNGVSILVPSADGSPPSSQNIDTVQRTSVTGTVVAKDGLTVAVGGLIEDVITDNREQVPILGKIPGLGFFFRRQLTGRNRTELVVLIRPYVFNTPQESAALSADLIPELSLHPFALDPGGSLETFAPEEVLRPDPPQNQLQSIFRFHSVLPKAY